MKKVRHLRLLAGSAIFVTTIGVNAATIDFESVPGVGTPTEGVLISNQYLASAGISFALEGGGNPRIAKVGSPRTAFEGFGGADDMPAPNQGIGTFFLTDNGTLGGLSSPALLIVYATPTAAASGVLLDIDFDETWTIQARDSADNIIDVITITAGDFNTGDGLATVWSFNRTSSDINSIRFKGTRTATGAFGLGFDNFSPTQPAPIPLPGALWAFASGLKGLMSIRASGSLKGRTRLGQGRTR